MWCHRRRKRRWAIEGKRGMARMSREEERRVGVTASFVFWCVFVCV